MIGACTINELNDNTLYVIEYKKSQAYLRILINLYDRAFCEIVNDLSTLQNISSQMFDRILNIHLRLNNSIN